MPDGRQDPCDVEAARRMFDLWTRATARGPDGAAWLAFAEQAWTDDVVYHEDPSWPGAGNFAGRSEVTARFWEYGELIASPAIEVVEVVAGRHAVLGLIELTGAGDASGAPIRQRWGYVLWTREGKVREFHAHLDIGEARTEAGG